MSISAAGIIGAQLLDRRFADPASWHPVAGFGRYAKTLERRLYKDDRLAGTAFLVAVAGPPAVLAAVAQRQLASGKSRQRAAFRGVVTAATTWCAVGGTSLLREGQHVQSLLAGDDINAARARLSHLCARDPSQLDEGAMARATVESLAENTSDAVVAPLFWAAVAGLPGVVTYRAVNTLDAMVGYRSLQYARFGWASARADDVLNLIPARITGALAALLATSVGGRREDAWRTMRRDARRHPSPNAGYPEAAFAGALAVRLGGANVYHGQAEIRAPLGEGSAPGGHDIARAVLLSRRVADAATVLLATAVTILRCRSIHHRSMNHRSVHSRSMRLHAHLGEICR